MDVHPRWPCYVVVAQEGDLTRSQLRELLKRERRSATPGLRPLAQRVGVL